MYGNLSSYIKLGTLFPSLNSISLSLSVNICDKKKLTMIKTNENYQNGIIEKD